ncbi:glutaminyl-peptide cyclotransferase [Leptolyngbya sp. 7M]|uniref:glutaminyl-peptide cyclotransferase n=1 Tax=Leptolyngbya sp. 7M TaxID=2812896 RepID=UPI001B8D6189|nr:glutaminyl-peptide cyclotransferase [Leptolyngbya sp. 7M]QYO66475.1 glutaminyl-peptide cyclotransferase [Leptolyngbya sp. 7M]
MVVLLLVVFGFAGCGGNAPANNAIVTNGQATSPVRAIPTYSFEVVKTYPHDPTAFTQGLVYHGGFLYEGTGGEAKDWFISSIRKVDLNTGKVLQKHEIPRELFGEGIAILNDKLFQLTWRNGKAFVYNLSDFRLLQEFTYSGQGWGLTEDGTNLYMSDGTHVIRVIDPENFKTVKTIVVKDERGRPVMQLNELEWIKGEIWANIWQRDIIVRIDPSTGNVVGRIDLEKLADEERRKNATGLEERRPEVLNGIAYDAESDRIFVTGKLWRNIYEIKLQPAS